MIRNIFSFERLIAILSLNTQFHKFRSKNAEDILKTCCISLFRNKNNEGNFQ